MVAVRQRQRLGELPGRAPGRHAQQRELHHARAGCRTTRRAWPATSRTSTPTSTTTTWPTPARRSRPSGTEAFELPAHAVHADRAACPDFVCSWDPETPNSWQTNADAERRPDVLLPRHASTTTSPPTRSGSPGRPATSRRSTVTRSRATRSTAPTPPVACRTATTSTTPTWPRRPTARRRGCRCTCSTSPGTAFPDEDPFIAGNCGDEADVVYHEYTHGLSNRLVVDANGNSTLGNIQAGSMGEAWSDWYAMDFLVNQGLFTRHHRPTASCGSASTSGGATT